MKLKPIGNRVFVRRLAAAEKIGSIILPEAHKDAPQIALVLEAGEGPVYDGPGETVTKILGISVKRVEHRRQRTLTKAGDYVIFPRYAGAEVELLLPGRQDVERVFMLREDEILAVVEDAGAPVEVEPAGVEPEIG